MKTLERDVVIVGAGPSGLMAARTLTRAGLSVAVLEARDRVGGRTWSKVVDGAFLEIGGQWISPDQTALKALVEELGLERFQRYREGKGVYIGSDGQRHEYDGDMFPVSETTAAEMTRLTALLDELAESVGASQPWAHEKARELDTISFQRWLEENSDDAEARNNIGLFIAGGMITKPAHSFSALQAVLMSASAGSFTNLTNEDFILDERVVGGMQSVSLRMAEELGEDVILDSPVRTVRWGADGVTAESERAVVAAKRLIMAVPPNLYSRVSFVPPLPRRQHQMHQHQSLGLVIKVHAVYETPFWRDKGLSGTAFGANSLVQEVYDNTNHGDDRGTLVAFVTDEKADAVFELSDAERRERILSGIAEYLGEEAKSPVVYYESDWGSEEWTRGAYAASYDLGGLSRYGKDQLTPVGPIHWSCSDLAAEGYQHVDGAVRMGRATAEQIAADLAADSESAAAGDRG